MAWEGRVAHMRVEGVQRISIPVVHPRHRRQAFEAWDVVLVDVVVLGADVEGVQQRWVDSPHGEGKTELG